MSEQIYKKLESLEGKVDELQAVVVSLARVEEQRESDRQRIEHLEEGQHKLDKAVNNLRVGAGKMASTVGLVDKVIEKGVLIVAGYLLLSQVLKPVPAPVPTHVQAPVPQPPAIQREVTK